MTAPVPRRLEIMAAWAWRILVLGLVAAAIFWVASKLSLVVVPVLVALVASTLLVPPARWLERHGFPDGLAAATVSVVVLAVLAGAAFLVGPPVVAEFSDLDVNLRAGVAQIGDWIAETFGISDQRIEQAIDRGLDNLRENAGAIVGGVLGGVFVALEVVIGIVLALFVLFFVVKDGESMWSWFCGLFPERRRDDVRELGERAYRALGQYLLGVAFVGLVDAVLIAIGLYLLDVPLVLPLALLVFFGAFFPIVGAWLSGLAAVLVALVDEGFVVAAIVAGLITGVQQLEGNVLYPLVVGRSLHLHPIVVLLALTAGGVLAGIAGAFLAVPLAAVAASWIAFFRAKAAR